MQGYDARTALAVVVANMIGTGVFTSLGYQLVDIQSGFVILALWVLGGVAALCGALCYAELGAALPRSGGEYNFLSQIYHPAAGFVSGWVSATVGFAAPVALVAITFGAYLAQLIPALPQTLSACVLIALLSLAHGASHSASGKVQNYFTAIKVFVIAVFCVLAFTIAQDPQPISFMPQAGDAALFTGSAFAVALIYVNYAYTGWNAATYISSELKDPQRSLPRVLALGTLIVTTLYVLLNAAFLYLAPMSAMEGKIEIGYIAGRGLFGEFGAQLMAGVLALLLVSTVSAMTLAGPRVLRVLGEDYSAFRWLAAVNNNAVPARAIFFQSAIAIGLVLTASFESILVFTGFILGLNTLFAVLGVFVLRARAPDLVRPYRITAYPLPPIIFSAITLWTLWHILQQRPVEGWLALAIIAAGLIAYWLLRNRNVTTLNKDTHADAS